MIGSYLRLFVLTTYALHSGLLDTLNEMNTKLEEIQKSLDMYLETKRQIFPRFYFLSNDDLLEILGQSKNPDAVSDFFNTCSLFFNSTECIIYEDSLLVINVISR